ncbi:unnamed protein product [Prunus armeniaca]|uniref:Uncharacterized protein n=1 Tax=Prunus armeniaca TaxID=36596 RepID=A0A6J5TDG6_PRUAR|nr:unnamed protein product [Prunus armeniaca]
MASAQALKDLEAGKRKLEEFRKKKAAERAKKASSTSQANAPEEQAPLNNSHSSPSTYYFNDQVHKHASDQEYKSYGGFGFAGSPDVNHSNGTKGMNNDFEKYTGNSGETTSDQSIALRPQASQDFDTNTSALLQSEASNVSTVSGGPTPSSLYEGLAEPSTSLRGFPDEVGKNMHGSSVDLSDPITFRFGEGKLTSSASGFHNLQSTAVQTSESMGFGSDARSSSLYSVTPEIWI